jgi:hypothetical protein
MGAFYDKLGRPETPDDYGFDIGAHDQEGSYNAFRESAHKQIILIFSPTALAPSL